MRWWYGGGSRRMSDDNSHDKDKEQIEIAKNIINRYRDSYKHIKPDVLFNLSTLKDTASSATVENLDEATDTIRKTLGEAEAGETLRNERWHGKVSCPYCESTNIKRLAKDLQENTDNFKYLCLSCNEEFNDDSATAFEKGVPPLHTWMFCWYLLGCTSSIQYISAKLGLPASVVEVMIQQMQRLFKTNEPMQHFMSFDEWSLKVGKSYKAALQEAIAKQVERFRGYSLGQEADTAEVRRQKNRNKFTP